MDWEAIGAVGEVVGAAGVIASLLYVAQQVRASNRASAVEAKLESTRLQNDYIQALIDDPELNDLMLRGRQGLGDLSPSDFYRFSNMALKAFWYLSAGYFQLRRGTLSEDDWFEQQAILNYWLESRGFREWWQKVGRHMFGREMSAFVESEIARREAA
jgi:hypothetical protein